MSVFYFLVPMTIALSAAFVGVFVWAVRNGQFDDCDTPRHRMLVDDREPGTKPSETDEPA